MEGLDICYQGTLDKISSGILKNKAKVWVILTKDALSLFRHEKRSSCIGSVELADIQAVHGSSSDPAKFEIIASIKSYKFVAESAEVANVWRSKIEQCIKDCSGKSNCKLEKTLKVDQTDIPAKNTRGGSLFGVKLKSARNVANSLTKRVSDNTGLRLHGSDSSPGKAPAQQVTITRSSLPACTKQQMSNDNANLWQRNNSLGKEQDDVLGRDIVETNQEKSSTPKESQVQIHLPSLEDSAISCNVKENVPRDSQNTGAVVEKETRDISNHGNNADCQNASVTMSKNAATSENDNSAHTVLKDVGPESTETVDMSDVVLRRSRITRSAVIDEEDQDSVEIPEVQLRNTSRSRSGRSIQAGSRGVEVQTESDNGTSKSAVAIFKPPAVQSDVIKDDKNIKLTLETNGNDTSGETINAACIDVDVDVDESAFDVSKTTNLFGTVDVVCEDEMPGVKVNGFEKSQAFENLKVYLQNNSEGGFCIEEYKIKEKNSVQILRSLLGV